MAFKGRKSSNKNPPIFSHEFVIQNHADIVSCVALVFVIGLMIQATSPIAYMFIALHHNVSMENGGPEVPYRYTYGLKDICVVFFYFLICIVMHAIIQEYILDKITRKLHLSKAKHSKFNESGQLLVFYVMSVLWGGDVIIKENLIFNISALWEGYPHDEMLFMFKFFFIIQLAYWFHAFPELYFQKTKKEEMAERIAYATIAIVFIAAAYLLNFTRVGICLLVLHYLSECFYHVARLIDFVDKEERGSKAGYMVWHVFFVLARLGSVMLSVLTFWYGLSLAPSPTGAPGDFNSPTVRVAALSAVVLLQVYLMFNFITDQLRQLRETAPVSVKKITVKPKLPEKKKKVEAAKDDAGESVSNVSSKKSKKNKRKKASDLDELTEVDQNTKKNLSQTNLKQRPLKKVK